MVYFFAQLPNMETYFYHYAFIPSDFFGGNDLITETRIIPPWMTIFSSMFSHGGVMHLFFNMWFLWLYADNMEDALGWKKFILFYLLCGAIAAIAQGLVDTSSVVPMIGASGAISGVMSGYLLIWPRANIRVFYWIIIFVGRINVPAFVVLGFWLFQQFWALPSSMTTEGGVAIVAHLAGFAAGIILTPLLKKKEVPLFQQPFSSAFRRRKIILNKKKVRKGSVPKHTGNHDGPWR
ncbi:MAG: rhomboid family intramembrane serine protease [Pseudomonadota bacterium]|nr:rhomboid family intramembrane serine protease [Pseudomonadota bacterium]